MNLWDFPNLIKAKIVSHLDKSDVDNLCLTNKRICQCIGHNDILWRSLVRAKFNYNAPNNVNSKQCYYDFFKQLIHTKNSIAVGEVKCVSTSYKHYGYLDARDQLWIGGSNCH